MSSNVLRLGLGGALLVTLGFGSGLAPIQGNYVTLGTAQSAKHHLLLGLVPGAALPPPPLMDAQIGEIRIPIESALARRLRDDDELMLFVVASALATRIVR